MSERMVATNREDGGKLAKNAQISWLRTQEGFNHSKIIPWEELSEECKEEYRCIWESIAVPYLDVIKGVREGFSELSEAIDMLSLLEIKEGKSEGK